MLTYFILLSLSTLYYYTCLCFVQNLLNHRVRSEKCLEYGLQFKKEMIAKNADEKEHRVKLKQKVRWLKQLLINGFISSNNVL